MGAAKHEMMRFQEERWAPTDDDRRVCKQCFADEGIRQFISSNADEVGCDFCEDQSAEKRKSLEIDKVIEFIAECINREYGEPQSILPWDSEDKCYFGESEMQSTEDLISDLIESPHAEVSELILSAFDEAADWVHVHALRDSLGQAMTSLWGQFAESVKHERRFFFKRPSKNSIARIINDGAASPADILTAISNVSKKTGLFRFIEKGQKLYRARRFFITERPPFDLENFGVPDKETSKRFPNRMSPAGIPIFYGAENLKTAVAEVAYAKGDTTAVATFEANRKLLVLDLTLIPTPPSIFQESDWELRQAILFLNQLRREIMKKIDRKGHEHVDYIPSQIFTEFFRFRVKYKNQKVDGVVFPSIHHPEKRNFALFCDNTLICDTNNSKETCLLKYSEAPKIVTPKNSS